MPALPAPPKPRRAGARPLWPVVSCLLLLGSCGGNEFSSGEPPPSGSGGTGASEGGVSGASIGGRAGATGASGEGGSGRSAGGAGSAGSASGASGEGAAGDSEGGQGGDVERCRVECCDGSLLVENYPDADACFSLGAEACGAEGPLRADFMDDTWQPSVAACPTNRDCNLTCCNGEERAHTTFDEPLCVSSARGDPFCDERGGIERVEFDGGVVWEGVECALDYNCLATCCDGSRSYITQEGENECGFYGMYACEHDGGPIDVAFEGRTVFTADVECPTVRTCILECCDGFQYDRSPAFGTNNCVFFNATSSVCSDEGHVANKQVVFGGEVAWAGTCP
jgi:hypothetical protein